MLLSDVRVDRLVVERNRKLVSLCSSRSIAQVVVRDAPCLEELSLGDEEGEGDDANGVDSGDEQQQDAKAIKASGSVDLLLSLAGCAALTYLHVGDSPCGGAARRLLIGTFDCPALEVFSTEGVWVEEDDRERIRAACPRLHAE